MLNINVKFIKFNLKLIIKELCLILVKISKSFLGCETKIVKLFFKTLYHFLNAFLKYFVLFFGFNLLLHFTDEQLRIPEIALTKTFAPGYLTNWNYVFQTVFLSLALICDILEWLNKHQTDIGKKLQYYRDITFSGLVVPFTLFISSMFWIVFSIDRELVFPTVYDQIVPWWFNHCVHTNITIVVLVETILQARRYPKDMKMELCLVTIVNIGYAIVYYSIYFITNRWLYGVFGIMTWWQVCLYQLLIWTSAFVFYFLQFPVNRIFHKEDSMAEQKSTEVEKTVNSVETNGDASTPTKSWSLKYRSIRSENSKL